ncbi:DeoR family transcriptional regulator [Micromonospora chalcea]|uniref:DeoR family transcriptional regulator n=1 Tax=Micromonospora chalcea TaxID=1874 RepID=UPI00380BD207
MGDEGATRLSSRRWRTLSYLAQHGSASTLDVALVCAVSRLTAHRDLVWLHEAGLVRRERSVARSATLSPTTSGRCQGWVDC